MREIKIKRMGLKMCGITGGSIVPCGPKECYRVGNVCRTDLAGFIRSHHKALESLLDRLLLDHGPITPDEINKKASERFDQFVGTLLMLLARQRY